MDSAEGLDVALVKLGIDLAATFDQVEGCHGSVGKALVYHVSILSGLCRDHNSSKMRY